MADSAPDAINVSSLPFYCNDPVIEPSRESPAPASRYCVRCPLPVGPNL